MKIIIQELIKGNTEIIRPEIREEVEKELVEREIPFTISYVNEIDTIDTIVKKVVSTSKLKGQ